MNGPIDGIQDTVTAASQERMHLKEEPQMKTNNKSI